MRLVAHHRSHERDRNDHCGPHGLPVPDSWGEVPWPGGLSRQFRRGVDVVDETHREINPSSLISRSKTTTPGFRTRATAIPDETEQSAMHYGHRQECPAG
jgi:hypothetical protein